MLFATLLDRMLTQDKIAICKMTPRVNSQSRFVALYPQVNQFFFSLFEISC